MRILLVEDDALPGGGVCQGLRYFDHTVDCLHQGDKVFQALQMRDYDLLVLDPVLPDMDGLDLLKTLRERQYRIPVMILTCRHRMDDKLFAFACGADDYMVKPFDMRELGARIKSIVRRQKGEIGDTIRIGRALLHCSSRSVDLGQRMISFSRREYPIVQEFFENPDKICTRSRLETLSYGCKGEIGSNALEVHIHNTRKKIGLGAIKTVRGVGYMLIGGALQ